MPVYQLTDKLTFPHPSNANEDGLLAIGGDLSTDRLLLAYSHGIFPWYDDDSTIMWWALNPRMILYPKNFKIPKSLKQLLKKTKFEIKFDTNFEAVINNCKQIKRAEQDGTWITNDMKQAYIKLHYEGYAHSVETYYNSKLVGGLYGISIGGVFFGESMFQIMNNASKIAFVALTNKIFSWNFDFIDAQQETPLLKSFGADLITFDVYYSQLQKSIKKQTKTGNWSNITD